MAETPTHFGGVAGDVLRRTLNRTTWFSGMALVSALFLTARGLGVIDQAGLFPLAALLIVALGLAHHGVRAAVSHASALHPGDGRTFVVATRVAMASAVWLVPWMLWSNSLERSSPVLSYVGTPSPLAAALFLFCCLVATPACLIAAVHSKGWMDVLSPAHWARQFAGRGSDLMTVYTIQAGGALLMSSLMIPLVFGAFRINLSVGLGAAALSACLVLGYWVSLTGGLGGSIHAASPVGLQITNELTFDDPARERELNRDLPVQPAPDVEQEPVGEVAPDERPASDPVAESSRDQALSKPANPTNEPAETEQTLPDIEEAEESERYPAPSKPVAFDVPKSEKNDRKTPLLDAENRVAEAMKRFRLDPSHTLSTLTELNQRFAPSPHVLQSLTICLHRTGHVDEAFKIARQAFPLCFEYGFVSLAAAMFYELRADLTKLQLKEAEVLEIAKVLHRADELAAAAKAYSLVIHANPNEILAVKGLLDLAERILHVKRKPAASLKIYTFLLDHCPDPTMTTVVQDGIAKCRDSERKVSDAEVSV
ncbi:MAG: hypothetical protein GTN89_13240 [Acidobacteria bacterium]|nr:hypothetical protein [Acidobacteriota bacterium]NIM60211.1 hypothetical protein [Acidobacteriota bacterium]NIO60249.1 hypothetical protein [Acidobacteriota bacterium]NIQ31304.1 hypothetical protein [Acidobacteriota bacterium]NIQ86527.1 hypothetical protein [Acidobacteriota bacterium]